jgi:uncharacterized damage-inducible protein DinB
MAEILWFMRVQGGDEIDGLKMADLVPFWTGEKDDKWSEISKGMKDTEERIFTQCDRWMDLIKSKSDEELAGKTTYKDTQGKGYEKELGLILDHIVNHGTHHR